jgi:hypothetical protein
MSGGEQPLATAGRAAGGLLDAEFAGCTPARLFEAARRAAHDLGFATIAEHPAAGTLAVRSSIPATTLAGAVGPEMLVTVNAAGEGARIVVSGRREGGYGLEFARSHQLKSTELMFLDRIAGVLPSVPEPGAEAGHPHSTVDDLRTLADLKERGLITEEEFAAQKQRLLG